MSAMAIVLRLFALACLLGWSASAAAERLPEVRATALLGSPVLDASGRPIGNIGDLVLELNGERVGFAVVGSAAYPITTLALEPRGRIVLDPAARPRLLTEEAGISARELIGREVQHLEGEHLGDIRDFSFSPATGYLHYVIVELSGGTERAIPTLAISLPAAPGARAIVTGPGASVGGSATTR
jgi:sporulation protein YlmC with PRC-barrel domain